MITIPASIMAVIASHGEQSYPEECCGILLGTRPSAGHAGVQVMEHRPSENLAPAEQRKKRYVIDPQRTLAAERRAREQGLEVIGFYHSHPDHAAVPSTVDAADAWDAYVYVIISITGKRENGADTTPHASTVRAWQFAAGSPEEIALTIT